MPDRRLLALLELIRHQSDRLLLLLDQMDVGAFLLRTPCRSGRFQGYKKPILPPIS